MRPLNGRTISYHLVLAKFIHTDLWISAVIIFSDIKPRAQWTLKRFIEKVKGLIKVTNKELYLITKQSGFGDGSVTCFMVSV